MAPPESKPYVRAQMTPELVEMLERWKQWSGNSHATTVRMALYEYLSDKLREIPRTRLLPMTDGERAMEHAKEMLAIHYHAFIEAKMNTHGSDLASFLEDLGKDLKKNREAILNATDRDPKSEASLKDLSLIVKEMVKNDQTLHDYMTEALEPRSRRRTPSK